MSIVEITTFQTTDGALFDNLQKAQKHQVQLDLRSLLFAHKQGKPGGIGTEDLLKMIAKRPDLFQAYIDSLKED